MEWREALRILQANGLLAKPLVGLEVSPIEYKREKVGFIQEDRLYLCNYVPSIVHEHYGLVPKSHIEFSDPNWKVALITAIVLLKDTAKQYESKKRKAKIENIRHYFERSKALKDFWTC